MENLKFNVINFHLTEVCNYRCTYCFAKFKNENELNLNEWTKAVDIVSDYFKRNKIKKGRINLAGGEPLVLPFLDDLIDYIYSKGIIASIITNGSLLTKERIDKWTNKIETLGVSVDSLNKETNLSIGRNSGRKTLDLNNLIEVLNYAKEKQMKLKVNTVVSKLNIEENILPLYKAVNFDRVKLLQVRIQGNCNENAKKHEITNEDFKNYVEKIVKEKRNIVIEPEEDIESSYIIIDPHGNLISNENNYHNKTGSIFEENLEDLILKAGINYETFIKRYIPKDGNKI
ncbi:viperin family antiviral radical SAM protein [Acholeplasma laidlawii]|uniref:viperin family antiviral radical SAM protein n=1 Tax=Acholeplasma laidlawii TaxID=2148 RepID=UPI0021F7942E|nr:viperin family antiviral radical SAM protein [Acholeplasma laidlawii]